MRQREAGSAVVELTLIAPVLLLLLLLVVAAGRLAAARLEVDNAARQAARAASLERSPSAAARAAELTAASALGERSVSCQEMSVSTDTARFQPGGSVSVTVRCAVALADLSLLRLPGTQTITGSFSEVVDVYRGVVSR
jgi:Flp pilus assembly protein TadG